MELKATSGATLPLGVAARLTRGVNGEPPITSPTNPRIKAAVRAARPARARSDGPDDRRRRPRDPPRARRGRRGSRPRSSPRTCSGREDARRSTPASRDRPAAIEVSPAVLAEARVRRSVRRDRGASWRRPTRTLDDLGLPADPLILVVEGVEKPGNLGAVLRTRRRRPARCGDRGRAAHGPVQPECHPGVDRDDLQRSRGGRASTADVRRLARDPTGSGPSRRVVGAAPDYTEADLTGPLAIVARQRGRRPVRAWHGAGVDADRASRCTASPTA